MFDNCWLMQYQKSSYESV